MATMDDGIAKLSERLPEAVVRRVGPKIVVAEASAKPPSGAVLEASGPLADAYLSDDRDRAMSRENPLKAYQTYHQRLRLLAAYREVNPRFSRLMFDDLERAAVTDAKVVVSRPTGCSDEDYEALVRRVETPFAWFAKRVNAGLPGYFGGQRELLASIAEHLLEGGLCGYWLKFSTVELNGVKWRVPTRCQVWSGSLLASPDEQRDPRNPGRWYLSLDASNPISTGIRSRGPDFSDPARWQPLEDAPQRGRYAGVWRVPGNDGRESVYPRLPWLSALDPLLGIEMLRRDDLSTLAQNQRHIVLWTFDLAAMNELGIGWDDQENPDGTTTDGGITQFMDLRQAAVENEATGSAEYGIPSYISYSAHRPGLELLLAAGKYEPLVRELEALAGLLYDPDGGQLKDEIARRQESDFDWLREQLLEPCGQRIFDAIVAENQTWFGRLNGDPTADPFRWESPAWKRHRGWRPGETIPQRAARERRELELRLSGAVQSVEVAYKLVPASLNSAVDALWAGSAVQQGNISEETYHEVVGLDHDRERQRMLRQKTEDRLVIDPETRSLWEPDPTYAQTSQRPDGTVTETRSQQSVGRPARGTAADGS